MRAREREHARRHAEHRAEETWRRVEELRQRYGQLVQCTAPDPDQLSGTAAAVRDATIGACAAYQVLIVAIGESAAAHDHAAEEHECAAAWTGSHVALLRHLDAAQAHRVAAIQDRQEATQLKGGRSRMERFEPHTLPQLLRMLGVSDKSAFTHWRAIVAWLADNTLTSDLWASIQANGYGIVIERLVPDFHRPTPRRRVEIANRAVVHHDSSRV